jgi:hypothetical protein
VRVARFDRVVLLHEWCGWIRHCGQEWMPRRVRRKEWSNAISRR